MCATGECSVCVALASDDLPIGVFPAAPLASIADLLTPCACKLGLDFPAHPAAARGLRTCSPECAEIRDKLVTLGAERERVMAACGRRAPLDLTEAANLLYASKL